MKFVPFICRKSSVSRHKQSGRPPATWVIVKWEENIFPKTTESQEVLKDLRNFFNKAMLSRRSNKSHLVIVFIEIIHRHAAIMEAKQSGSGARARTGVHIPSHAAIKK